MERDIVQYPRKVRTGINDWWEGKTGCTSACVLDVIITRCLPPSTCLSEGREGRPGAGRQARELESLAAITYTSWLQKQLDGRLQSVDSSSQKLWVYYSSRKWERAEKNNLELVIYNSINIFHSPKKFYKCTISEIRYLFLFPRRKGN